MDPGMRIDLQNTLLHDLGLVLAYGLPGGDNLAVQIRQTHLVVVDEVERAHTAARKRLYRVAAHAADAEDRHTGLVQFFHGLVAKQQFGSRKLIEHSVPLMPKALSY